MEGKLKKIGNEYKLYAQDDSCIATTHESPYKKLSLKNCEAIANGYDLDELAENTYREYPTDLKDSEYHYNRDYQVHKKRKAFIKGFKKALEFFGDKKFSVKELTMLFAYGHQIGMNDVLAIQSQHSPQPMPKPDSDKLRDELIQSLQQTEWDVEAEIELYHDGDFIDDSKTHIIEAKLRPRLDSDGCLILKRI